MQLAEAISKKDWWDELPDSIKYEIAEGIDDVENGCVISSDEFWNILKNGDYNDH